MASFQVADGLATAIYNKIKNTICNLIYPVGSIKMTVTNTNPYITCYMWKRTA